MQYFDAHTHTNFAAYDTDRDDVMARAKEAGVAMNVVGTQLDTSRAAVDVAQKYENAWATVGLHPTHTAASHHDAQELGAGGAAFAAHGEVFDAKAYEALASYPRVIAIGECGLDYYRIDKSTKDKQAEVFIQQIEIANRLGKPLMLHIRNAYEDALAILRAHAKTGGDVHFFAGDWAIARQFLDLGFTLSFTGVITFTNDYDEVVKNTPIDMMLSETDAPYVAPVPYRGKRNEPLLVTQVVNRIAEIRSADADVVAAQLVGNAERLFRLL